MKLKISRIELLKKLRILNKMPKGSEVMSKLSGQVFISTEYNDVKMMVYDGSNILSVIKLNQIEFEQGEENLVSIDLKLFLSIVSKVEEDIEIIVEDKVIKINSGRCRFELYRGRLEEIWKGCIMPNVENSILQFEIDSDKLKNMLTSVIVSASEEKGDKSLSVIKLGVKNSVLELSATDGYRAGMIFENISCDNEGKNIELLLLRECVSILTEVLGTGKIAKLNVGEGAILLEIEDTTVIVRGMQLGKYPDITTILTSEGSRTISINKKEWSNAINGISNFGANLIKIENKFTLDKVTISGESDLSKLYDVSGEVDVAANGDMEEGMRMLFRNRLLIDGIKSVEGDMVEIRMKGPNDFITIRPVGKTNQVNVILPCRSI